jgi:hypothetical protein
LEQAGHSAGAASDKFQIAIFGINGPISVAPENEFFR